MTEQQIEIAAQAIRDVVSRRLAINPKRYVAWYDLPESLRDQYRREAIAAAQAFNLT